MTWPWNVGMIGWKPATTFAVGFRIDSRTYAASAVSVLAVAEVDGRVPAARSAPARGPGSRRAVAGDAGKLREELLAALRERAFGGAPPSQAWYSACGITTTWPIIPECFVPQYSAQKM